MSLDVPTLLIFSAIVIVTASGLFLAEAWARTGAAVDRLWSLAFASAIMTASAYLAATAEPSLWWANGVGNGTSALTVWAMWNGVRAYSGQTSFVGVSVGVAALVAAALLVSGPDGGPWAGGAAVLGATALGAVAAGTAILRGPLRRSRPGTVLAVILLLAGGFYVVRLIVFVAVGPESRVFEQYLGTALTTIVTTVLVTSAAFVALTLRTQHARERATVTHDFDPATGARTAASFAARARQELLSAAAERQPVALLVVTPEELGSIAVAFGRPAADAALLTCAETVRSSLPRGGVMGRADESFTVLLPGRSPAQARAWATTVRKAIIDTPLTVGDSTTRVTASIGVAGRDSGDGLEELRAAAEAAAREALLRGGNRVLLSDDLHEEPADR